ncbi:hypothetical protein M408DRAFT_276762 [Serendipita vermifera MAFF 305830]|uniref:Ubiquitin-like domain-containing protein n=1 Tax=Serendipita vermifera MAFF 305830 TaxID=933852 RepID=A0A0C2X002_SERVB|nr:hypothetical protein M408DRAFT_276762 [Serendipita vermifera MAFF 305830]
MNRLAFELKLDEEEVRPADYFDMMAGVGFGGLCALLLGRLRMTPRLVADELEKVATAIFNTGDDEIASAEYAMVKLRMVIEDILRRHGHPCNIDLRDDSNNRCKVVVFAALEVVADHCRPFRTYVHPRSSKGVRHTFVDVACAILAFPEFLPPVLIGRPGREERFSGIPHGFHNPMQEVLKESQWLFDKERPVSLVLSLGPGQGPIISSKDYRGTTSSRIVSKTDTVAKELSQRFCGVGEYLRLNVDKGLDNVELDDWHALGSIVSHTEVYLELPTITAHIDRAVQWLLRRNGSVTLEQLVCSNNHSQIKFLQQNHNEQLLKVVKQMNEIVQEAIEKITLVDAVGIRIPISLQLCRSYETLIKVIRVYYEDQRPPGTRLVKKGHFELVSGNEGEVVKPIAWRCVVTPGLTVEMSMIRHDYHTEGMNCPRCGHAYTDWTTKGWTTWGASR